MRHLKLGLICAVLSVLAVWTNAHAQKTCVRNSPTLQTCTVTIGWTASVVDATHDAPTEYLVERSDGAGAKTQIGKVAASITSFQNVFTDAGNVNHCWAVRASNSGGASAPTPDGCWTTPAIGVLPPNPPSGITTAALSRSDIQLSWSDNSDNETKFVAEQRSFKPPRTATISIPAESTQWTARNLRKGSTYCYKLAAVAGEMYSAYTPESCATTRR